LVRELVIILIYSCLSFLYCLWSCAVAGISTSVRA